MNGADALEPRHGRTLLYPSNERLNTYVRAPSLVSVHMYLIVMRSLLLIFIDMLSSRHHILDWIMSATHVCGQCKWQHTSTIRGNLERPHYIVSEICASQRLSNGLNNVLCKFDSDVALIWGLSGGF
jgi:hypothetical protein